MRKSVIEQETIELVDNPGCADKLTLSMWLKAKLFIFLTMMKICAMLSLHTDTHCVPFAFFSDETVDSS